MKARRLSQARSNVESFGRFLESVSLRRERGSLMDAEQNLNEPVLERLCCGRAARLLRARFARVAVELGEAAVVPRPHGQDKRRSGSRLRRGSIALDDFRAFA